MVSQKPWCPDGPLKQASRPSSPSCRGLILFYLHFRSPVITLLLTALKSRARSISISVVWVRSSLYETAEFCKITHESQEFLGLLDWCKDYHMSTTGCPIFLWTWVGLTLMWVSRCPIPLLPNSHQPKQNLAWQTVEHTNSKSTQPKSARRWTSL